MTKLADLKQRLLENPEVRNAYAKDNAAFSLMKGFSSRAARTRNTQHKGRSADGSVMPDIEVSGNLSKWTTGS
ncbi:hypothetical protein [Paracoccus aerius]|uniref:Uncharacterized protein n=1 Tax=Paracoccus aerius TaxID=1915382 RepID=A0ABS1SA33_9RHOB|nr:hypothetical protein [Paracoccus aerius]MBL3675597.1 hypothetical protein [Paracoccus aerius]